MNRWSLTVPATLALLLGASAASADECQQVDINQWCNERSASGLQQICVDLCGTNRNVAKTPSRGVLVPNQGVVVVVRHEGDASVEAQLDGTRGLVRASTNAPALAKQDEAAGAGGAPPTPVASTSTLVFGPRRPGSVNVKLTKKRTGQPDVSLDVELEVDELSWGAVRLGFAAAFGGAASPSYAVRSMPGSQQGEIARAADPDVNFEATIGVAPYIFDIWLCRGHGRSHTGGCNVYISPYFGFGLVGQQGSNVQAFNGLYVGADLEFAPGFSVVAAATWRKVQTLEGGLRVGAPVDGSDLSGLTTEKTGFGFSLILNTTPGFLQFAAPSSTATPPASGSRRGGP
jgi:hypothetical protein